MGNKESLERIDGNDEVSTGNSMPQGSNWYVQKLKTVN